MLNDIVSAISIKLHEAFGDSFEIYTGQVRQGLKPPCFIVSFVSQQRTQYVGAQSRLANLFTVTYIPENVGEWAECIGIQCRLAPALGYITVGSDLLRGTGINSQLIDGALVFTANYDYSVNTVAYEEAMGAFYAPDIGVKG